MEVTDILTHANAGMNGALAFLSTISNAFVLTAIWKTPSLHTVTNVLVFGLALSDLGVGLLAQPLGIFLLTSRIGNVAVPIFQMFSGSLSAISLLTITAISVERYLALKLHLRHQELVTVRRVVYVLVLIWVCSIVAASSCLWYGVILFYKAASPVIVMCLLINIFVYQKLYRVCRVHHARIRDQATFLDEKLHQRAIAEVRFRKSVKTIFLILLALILCYLPFCCFTLAIITVSGDFQNKDGFTILETLYLLTWTMVFANSTVNPVLLYFQLTELRLVINGFLKEMFVCRHKSNNFRKTRNVKTQISLPATLGARFPRD